MTRKYILKIVLFRCCLAFILIFILKIKVKADVVVDKDVLEMSFGCLAPTDDEINSYENVIDCSNYINTTRTSIPTSVDLSSSIYFPPVANQYKTGSCAAFAGGYYQFTYERNKVKDVASNENSTWASPMWIYRMYGGTGNASIVYKILENYGPLSCNEDPYIVNSYGYAEIGTFPNNVEAMINEMEYRIIDKEYFYFDTEGTPITSSSSTVLQPIKQALSDGYTLYVSTLASGWVKLKDSSSNVYAIVRGGDVLGSGHGVLIVGYDDDFYFDINNNGVKDRGETGAFKIVNSWGTSFANDGFCWVMYDALNTVSYVPNNPWDAVSGYGNRVGIFSRENISNPENGFVNSWFYKIVVGKTNCDYMLQLKLNGQHLNWLSIGEQGKIDKGSNTLTSSQKKDLFVMPYVDEELSYNGQWVIDLTVTEEYYMQLDSKNEYIDYNIINNLQLKDPYSASERADDTSLPERTYLKELISSVTYKIISADGSVLSTPRTRTIGNVSSVNLNSFIYLDERGDVNCDGYITSADALLVLKFASRLIELSNLQKYYADYNMDGIVDATDANLILQEGAGLTATEAYLQISAMLNNIYVTQQN